MHQRGYLVLALLCWAVSCRAAAQQDSISFSEARQLILKNNGGGRAAATEAEAAEAGVRQAGTLPNPGIGVALDRFGTNEIEATVEQTFELGGKRRVRTEAARGVVEAAQCERDLILLELEAELVRRFVPAVVLSRKLSLLDSIIASAEATKAQIAKRVEAGASRKTDLVRAEIGVEQLALERSELLREQLLARKRFAALGGEQDSILQRACGSLDDRSALPSLENLRNAVAGSPQLAASDVERARLVAQSRQLKAEAVPDLNVSAGLVRNNAEHEYAPLVGLSMDLPLFNRNTAARAQVQLKGRALDERRAGTLRDLDAEVQDMHSRLQEIDREIAALETGTVPKAESVYSMLREFYNAGSVAFLDLAAAQAQVLRLRMELLDVEAERALVLADLMQTTSLRIQIVK
jgi:outer membrane protein, heavy metal efflux system